MSLEMVRQELLDGGLHEESVERLLDHYQSMQTRLQEGEYDEAGTHIGNFCENMVNIVLDIMGESVQTRPSVGTFVNECTSGKYGTDEPPSVRIQIPNTVRAAYDIRNNRDSVHVNLQVPVNHADTQAGIAMCSWMLAEILRVYGASSATDNMEDVGALIEELAEPVSDGDPLAELEKTGSEVDRRAVADALSGYIQIRDGQVRPDRSFTDLESQDQVIVLLLGRWVASDLGHLDSVDAKPSWLGKYTTVTGERDRQIAEELDFVEKSDASGGYSIPSYRIGEATDQLLDK